MTETRKPRRNDLALILPRMGASLFRINAVEFDPEGEPITYWLVDDSGGRVIPEFDVDGKTRAGIAFPARSVIAVYPNILEP
jgi:hypothetical protein